MKFLEKDLEEIIYNADLEKLSLKGLYVKGKLKRQLRIGNYGIADLVSISRPYYHTLFKRHMKGVITVMELKQEKIGVSTFFQALNYAKGIKHWISLNRPHLHNSFNYRIVLIGREFDRCSSFVYLNDLFEADMDDVDMDDTHKTTVDLYQYKYDLDGISFREIYGYSLVDPGFKVKQKSTPF